ncbi:MAG: alpha/beta fold hydrolase [Gammaproteobacteria bacterium]|nr:alpha/beta fold hydrolase [Gammaproteobacteria bacterium]
MPSKVPCVGGNLPVTDQTGECLMATPAITRHFATITGGRWGARQVHYRRAGSGPVVLCLHQSPLSSRDMLATLARWHPHFTCIAPDTPGFGLSDPLGVPRAEMTDFADAVVEFMDALGIARAAVYGFHTGAMITLALAAHHPQRIACAVANGVVLLTEQERADMVEHYLPPLLPAWDGSHLAWLWARLREQTIFFPWYRAAAAARLGGGLPPPATLQGALLDFMRSGDHYRVGYRAAFTLRSDEALRRAAAPLLATAASTDVLSKQLPRIRNAADCVTVRPGGTPEETLDLCRDFISRHARGRAAVPAAAPAAALPCLMRQDFVAVPGGQLRLRRNDDASGIPVVLLHDATGSADALRGVARGFIGRRPVLALDLPGHGESDAAPLRGKPTIDSHARAVVTALDALGTSDRLARLRVPTLFAAAPADPCEPDTRRAAEAHPQLPFIALADDPTGWAEALLAAPGASPVRAARKASEAPRRAAPRRGRA